VNERVLACRCRCCTPCSYACSTCVSIHMMCESTKKKCSRHVRWQTTCCTTSRWSMMRNVRWSPQSDQQPHASPPSHVGQAKPKLRQAPHTAQHTLSPPCCQKRLKEHKSVNRIALLFILFSVTSADATSHCSAHLNKQLTNSTSTNVTPALVALTCNGDESV